MSLTIERLLFGGSVRGRLTGQLFLWGGGGGGGGGAQPEKQPGVSGTLN